MKKITILLALVGILASVHAGYAIDTEKYAPRAMLIIPFVASPEPSYIPSTYVPEIFEASLYVPELYSTSSYTKEQCSLDNKIKLFCCEIPEFSLGVLCEKSKKHCHEDSYPHECIKGTESILYAGDFVHKPSEYVPEKYIPSSYTPEKVGKAICMSDPEGLDEACVSGEIINESIPLGTTVNLKAIARLFNDRQIASLRFVWYRVTPGGALQLQAKTEWEPIGPGAGSYERDWSFVADIAGINRVAFQLKSKGKVNRIFTKVFVIE